MGTDGKMPTEEIPGKNAYLVVGLHQKVEQNEAWRHYPNCLQRTTWNFDSALPVTGVPSEIECRFPEAILFYGRC